MTTKRTGNDNDTCNCNGNGNGEGEGEGEGNRDSIGMERWASGLIARRGIYRRGW
jgi:hypothetical protein